MHLFRTDFGTPFRSPVCSCRVYPLPALLLLLLKKSNYMHLPIDAGAAACPKSGEHRVMDGPCKAEPGVPGCITQVEALLAVPPRAPQPTMPR